ncbi:MAG: thiazole synthase [Pseudomonadota bacterium]
MSWSLAGRQLTSRLCLGSVHYPSIAILKDAVIASKAEVVTVSLRRETSVTKGENSFFEFVKTLNCHILPNTAGCRLASEAIAMAEMARQIFQTNWIKLEVIGDDYTLQPDSFGLVEASKVLIQKGFEVFPYCTDDLILCQRLVDCGCRILMPGAAPIGSGKGLLNPYNLALLRARLPNITLLVDAGIGKPSHAVQVMELGFDGVLLNTAIALAGNPVQMASAFRDAIIAGRAAFEAVTILERNTAQPSTSLIDTPFWQHLS